MLGVSRLVEKMRARASDVIVRLQRYMKVFVLGSVISYLLLRSMLVQMTKGLEKHATLGCEILSDRVTTATRPFVSILTIPEHLQLSATLSYRRTKCLAG